MQHYQLGLELSYGSAAYDEYASSPSFVSTCSSTNMSIAMSTSSSSSDECQGKRSTVVMMHNPYSFDAFTYMQRLSDETDACCECDDCGHESGEGSDAEEASPTSSKQKKPKKKNVRCPNGHRAAKRLRYRKGQSHYSCNECTIRWKVDDPKRRPAFV